MSKKLYVFGVYSPDLDDYPYLPFTGPSIADGICQFVRFISDRDKICPNPELHLIGTAYRNHGCVDNIQPTLCPQKVTFDTHLIGMCVALGTYYINLIIKYLKRISVNNK